MQQASRFDQHACNAVFSDCHRYRYFLSRRWDAGELCAFVGLNPSTADITRNDATVRKCIQFACAWGFSGIALVNLYARRCRYPQALRTSIDPVGPDNDAWLTRSVDEASLVIAVWGNGGARIYGDGTRRDIEIVKRRDDWHCLGQTKLGAPKHPLYLPKATPLQSFSL